MSRCCQSRGIPDGLNRQNVRIRYRRCAVILPHIPPVGRVTEGATEIAFCRISRYVRRRMNGNAHVPDQKGQEYGKADAVCG